MSTVILTVTHYSTPSYPLQYPPSPTVPPPRLPYLERLVRAQQELGDHRRRDERVHAEAGRHVPDVSVRRHLPEFKFSNFEKGAKFENTHCVEALVVSLRARDEQQAGGVVEDGRGGAAVALKVL